MEWSERVITNLPLRELWDDRGPLSTSWRRDLTANKLRELLRHGPVRFVVVDVGFKPRWIPEPDRFDFWKGEVKPHLAEPDEKVNLERFPGEYCYFAAEWQGGGGSPIVVLQLCH
jgi:hypothetical protein